MNLVSRGYLVFKLRIYINELCIYSPLPALCIFYKQSCSLMRSSRYKEKKRQAQERPLCITYDEFNLLLSTLSKQQARQLELLIKDHTMIQHKPQQRYFTGNKQMMLEIHYLIDKFTSSLKNKVEEITYLDSDLSQSQSIEPSMVLKHVFYTQSLQVTRQGFGGLMEHVKIASALQSNRFQLSYSNCKQEMIKVQGRDFKNKIMITNRCVKKRRIYIIFEEISELFELQALIDEEIPLFMFKQVVNHFQIKGNSNMSMSKISNDKEVFYFMKKQEQDWTRFISSINKRFGSDNEAILMKFKLFSQLCARIDNFLSYVCVVIDEDQLRIDVENVSQIKVHQNIAQSIKPLTDLALQLLQFTSKALFFKKFQLDPITLFNSFLLQDRKVKKLYLVQAKSEKRYVYFTFYKKLMEIKGGKEGEPFELIGRTFTEEITDKYYLIAIENIRKHAVLNQLPFFVLPQEANQVQVINFLEQPTFWAQDAIRLIGYKYLLSKKRFKLVTEAIQDEETIRNRYEKHAFIIFDQKSPIFKKMGKLKSPSILLKNKITQKERVRGKIEVEAQFGRLFIQKCLEELDIK